MLRRHLLDVAFMAAGLLVSAVIIAGGASYAKAQRYKECHRNGWQARVWHDIEGCSVREPNSPRSSNGGGGSAPVANAGRPASCQTGRIGDLRQAMTPPGRLLARRLTKQPSGLSIAGAADPSMERLHIGRTGSLAVILSPDATPTRLMRS